MGLMSFQSVAEVNVYITFVLLGVSIMLVFSAITSAPSFVTSFYSYATGEPDAECEKPYFWDNANTFFNVATFVTQLSCETLTLVPSFRKIPLRIRMLVSLSVTFLELLLLIVTPAVKVPSQDGAIAVLMVVAILGGFSKALCDSTTNALVGPFPTKFMNGELWGLTVIALVMSLIEIVLKASMGTDFDDVMTQSRIYFGIAVAIQALTLIEFILMMRNPFAMRYVAEFRQLNRKDGEVDADGKAPSFGEPAFIEPAAGDQVQVLELRETAAPPHAGADGGNMPDAELYQKVDPCADDDDDDDEVHHVRRVSVDSHGNIISSGGGARRSDTFSESGAPRSRKAKKNGNAADVDNDADLACARAETAQGSAAVLRATGNADEMEDADQTGNLTSADQMVRTSLFPVVKKVWPMLFTCFFVYFTSLSLFPGVFFAVDRDSEWFSTIIVLLYNLGDFSSRLILMLPSLRPSPLFCLIGCLCRLGVVPFLALCVHGTIPGQWLPYILITIVGFTNGYFGAMSMIHCPRTTTLSTAGERSLAAVTGGVLLQCGLALGSNLALAINLLL